VCASSTKSSEGSRETGYAQTMEVTDGSIPLIAEKPFDTEVFQHRCVPLISENPSVSI
jgi:hypothetical protein